jgi:hypothetical protein
VITSEEEDADAFRGKARDERREVRLLGAVGLEDLLALGGHVEGAPGRLGERRAIGRAVMDDGDLRVPIFFGEEGAGERPLAIVAAGEAEDAGAGTAIRVFSVARAGRDLDDAGLVIDGRGEDRSAGAEMPDHQLDLAADHLVGDRLAELAVAAVVGGLEHEAFAEKPARGIDVVDGRLSARDHLGAENRKVARHRPGNTDGDLGRGGEGGEESEGGEAGFGG